MVTIQNLRIGADIARPPLGKHLSASNQLASSSLSDCGVGELEGLYSRRSLDHIRKGLQHFRGVSGLDSQSPYANHEYMSTIEYISYRHYLSYVVNRT
jgi:hypothetical protein